MELNEARRVLDGRLVFGDRKQILAVRVVELHEELAEIGGQPVPMEDPGQSWHRGHNSYIDWDEEMLEDATDEQYERYLERRAAVSSAEAQLEQSK